MPDNGPSTREYIEVRLNLLTVAIDKLEGAFEQRVTGMEKFRDAALLNVEHRFKHLEQNITTGQETAKRAVDKAESAQSAHNVASNEWRGTLNDFKTTLIGRPEFDKLSADFTAYRLEVARLLSAQAGEKAGTKDVREDSRAMWALVIAAAVGALEIARMFLGK